MTTTNSQSIMYRKENHSGFEPMQAAMMFVEALSRADHLHGIARVKVQLHGDFACPGLKDLLAATIIAGLQCDHDNQPQWLLQQVVQSKRLCLAGRKVVYFDVSQDLLFEDQRLPASSSGITITAKDADADILQQRSYWMADPA